MILAPGDLQLVLHLLKQVTTATDGMKSTKNGSYHVTLASYVRQLVETCPSQDPEISVPRNFKALMTLS